MTLTIIRGVLLYENEGIKNVERELYNWDAHVKFMNEPSFEGYKKVSPNGAN